MITRLISYYLLMIVSGVYTLIYHMTGGKSKKIVPRVEDEQTTAESEKAPSEIENQTITKEERSENNGE
jgi:hypothetical protein